MDLIAATLNPYRGANFFTFFLTLFHRISGFLTGKIGFSDLASDEIQLAVLTLMGLSAAAVGLFLLLRKTAMLANALSHTILIGIVLAYVLLLPFLGRPFDPEASFFPLPLLLFGAFLSAWLTTFLSEFLTKTLHLPEDASIGLVFTTLFATGILLVTLLTRNAHIGTEILMGNADALHSDDLRFVAIIALGNALLFALFFKEFTITTFDGNYAKTQGISPRFFHYLLMTQASATVIGGFRAIGVLMILAFITAPPLIARLFCHRLIPLLALSLSIATGAVCVGVALTRHIFSVYDLPLSTGGVIVTLLGFFYAICASFRLFRSKQVLTKSP